MTPINLGTLTDLLERKVARFPEAKIRFDFVYFFPASLHSYRGDYSQLAVGYSNEGDYPKAADFLKELRDADGAEFDGYKGGTYTMTNLTPVWVANSSEVGGTAIVDVTEDSGDIFLVTAYVK